MNTINIFLTYFIPNLPFIVPIIFFFLLTSWVGFGLFRSININKNWLIIISGSSIIGILAFILFLGILSWVFKGAIGISIIFCLFLLLGVCFNRNIAIPKIRQPKIFLTTFAICLLISIFLLFMVGTNIYGGDTIAYWAFATSFANGNYPVYSPWQPNNLATHHQGAFLYEGAVYAFYNTNIKLIHSLFSWFVLLNLFIFVWGVAREITYKKWISILIPLVFLFAFGAFYIPFPNFLYKNIIGQEVLPVTGFPVLSKFKDRLGGAANLNDLVYINHRALAIAGFVMIIYLASIKMKIAENLKILLIAILLIPSMSADEVILPGVLIAIAYWWIDRFIVSSEKKKELFFLVLSGIVFMGLFFIVGSALRDAILIPAIEPRFQIKMDWNFFIKQLGDLKGVALDYGVIVLFLPHILLNLFLSFTINLITKNFFTRLINISMIGFLSAYMFVEHTFYPGNQARFLHLLYMFSGLSLIINSLILISQNLYFKKALGIIIILLFIPILSTSFIYHVFKSKDKSYTNFTAGLPDYPVLSWSKKNLANKRLFFIDGYLRTVNYSYLTLNGMQDFGLIVPVSPAFIKVHTSDYGIEAVDTINHLDPKSMKDLKIQYLFMANSQFDFYPAFKRAQFSDSRYFHQIYSDSLGKMYEIQPEFFKLDENNPNLVRKLPDTLQQGSKIYLEAPPTLDLPLRSVFYLALQHIGTIYTAPSSGFFNYIEQRLYYSPLVSGMKYDYYVLNSKTDIGSVCNCQKFHIVWDTPNAKIYKRDE